MKILITGAHFTPAVAVIEELKQLKNVEIIYVGRKSTREGDRSVSIESLVLPKLGVKFISLITGRIQRVFTPYTILSLLKIPIGFIQSFFIIMTEQPNVILSFGGYVAVPVVINGWLWSTPIIVHEQTLVSGLANRVGGLFANKICLGFQENEEFAGEKTVFTGNPIREEVLHPQENLPNEYKELIATAKKDRLPVIFVTGGNQGSHALNTVVENCLDTLTRKACIIHQTGDSKLRDYERLVDRQNDRYLVKKWIDKEIGHVLKKVDLVISRAGANTLTEVAYLAKPTLVIPIPYLYKNEQTKNAHFFEKLGLVEILPQSQLSSNTLLKKVTEMISNLPALRQRALPAQKIAFPDAAKRVAVETLTLLSQSQ